MRAGALYRPYRNHHLTHTADIPEHVHRLAYLLMRTASEVLEEHLPEMRELHPDYVIADASAPWGQWAASALGVPAFTSVSTMAFNSAVMRYGFKRGARPQSAGHAMSKIAHIWKAWRIHRRLRRRYPQRPPGFVPGLIGRSSLHIVYTSRLFQPCVETFDTRYCFIGPSMSRDESDSFDWPDDPQPVVYVSFGTLFHDAAEFYRTCLEALAMAPVRVIMSIGPTVPMGALGLLPPNVSVHARVPQLQVLGRARAFISHGGMNSVSESLSFGVPLVVIPQMSEQLFVGRRAEELGAAIVLDKRAVSAASLRAAVDRVLSEKAYRQNAARIGDSFRTAGGPPLAVNAIDECLQRGDRCRSRAT